MPGKSKKGGGLESSPVYKKSGFKMKGSPFQRNFGISPMKQDQVSRQKAQQNAATRARRNKKYQLYELGYFQDDDGKITHPFGKGNKMDKAKWNEWKSKDENKPYKGKTKGLL